MDMQTVTNDKYNFSALEDRQKWTPRCLCTSYWFNMLDLLLLVFQQHTNNTKTQEHTFMVSAKTGYLPFPHSFVLNHDEQKMLPPVTSHPLHPLSSS